MQAKLMSLGLLIFSMTAHGWCESDADCPAGYYCSKHSVYVGNYCEKIYGPVQLIEDRKTAKADAAQVLTQSERR